MHRPGCRGVGAALLLGALLLSPSLRAAQLVALDLQPTGGTSRGLAETLTPVLLAELSRRPGLSIVSQGDVRALLENEARKQALGCDDTGCMTEIAGSLGAELLLTSSLGRVGRNWVVTLTLIEVEKAQVFRRVTGEQRGDDEAAAEAVQAAVHQLFRDGLPEELQGPQSMSRLGFRAALLGFAKLVRDPGQDPKPPRKRLIHDLVNTELDYDVAPKIDELDLTSRRQIAGIEDELLLARDAREFERLLAARGQWLVMRQDLERVKEIRTRARERGVAPSPRPLRFEDPEPLEQPDPARVAAYKKAVGPALQVVRQALQAYEQRRKQAFLALWSSEYQSAAERFFTEQFDSDQRSKQSYQVAGLHALAPWLLTSCIESHERGELLVFLGVRRNGEPYDDDRVYLVQQQGRWRIRSW